MSGPIRSGTEPRQAFEARLAAPNVERQLIAGAADEFL